MKIAVLADIHGNYYALNSVLKEANALEVDHLFILGDLVGYYYQPEKVLQELNKWPKDMIKGNHEVLLKEAYDDSIKLKEIINKYGHGIEIALNNLNHDILNELFALEEKKIVEKDSLKFELCHGSPWDINLYLYPDSNINDLIKCVQTQADFVLMGHTHHHFLFNHKDKLIINVGSVGQNRKKGGFASWVLINTQNKTVIFKQTLYNINELIKEIKKFDKDQPYLKEFLLR